VLTNLKRFVMCTEHCSGGLPKPDYAGVLRASKIVLAPSGWISAESFRVFEAMYADCVLITSPKPNF
jgi:hypothetical protein